MSNHTPATAFGDLLAKLRQLPSALWRLEARIKGVEFGGKCVFYGRPILSIAKGGRIFLGNNVAVGSSVRDNPVACFQPSVLRAMISGSQLVLGPSVGLSGTVLCAGASIEVGEGTIFGSGAMVMDHDFHWPTGQWGWATDDESCRKNARPIKIGRGVFVGARAIILKGVTIGDRAAIGAGAVVTKDVPTGHVAVGNPARVFRREN